MAGGRRPGQVTAAVVLVLLQAAFTAVAGVVLIRLRHITELRTAGLTEADLRALTGVGAVLLVVGAVLVAVGVGLSRRRRWARRTALVLEGLDAALTAVGVVGGAPQGGVGLLLAAAIIALLLSAPARSYFGTMGP